MQTPKPVTGQGNAPVVTRAEKLRKAAKANADRAKGIRTAPVETKIYSLIVVTKVQYLRCQSMTEAQAARENAKLRRQSDGRYLWINHGNQFGNIAIEETEVR